MAKLNPFRSSTKYDDDETDLLYYGYRYCNPSTGRWIGRDPAGENEGGPNLYVILSNDPTDDVDYLGLVDYMFEITEGGWSGLVGAAGTWGQPAWCANGMAVVLGARAYSSVTIKTRTNPLGSGTGNSCNSVNQPDPAGTIKLYLRNACPGNFQVTIYYMVQLTATGPQGALTGQLTAGGKRLVDGFGTTKSPFTADDLADFTTHVGTSWTLEAQYTPTISIGPDHGVTSTATAYGMIQFIGATPK